MNSTESDSEDITKIIGKKFLINEWRNTTLQKVSGIYKIVNKMNGKYYVGSSRNILGENGRWSDHSTDLIRGDHPNQRLQNAWNKYGPDSFEFFIIEITDDLINREQTYLDKAKLDDAYNLKYSAVGGKFSSESILKLKQTMMTSEKVKAARTDEWREKIRQSKLGKKRGEKYSQECRDRNLGKNNPRYGKTNSPEMRKKISESLKGRKLSEETKRKISETKKNVKHFPCSSIHEPFSQSQPSCQPESN